MNQKNHNEELLLTVSASPHIRDGSGINRIMWDVVIALLPAVLWSFYTFGLPAVLSTVISVVTCVVVEYIIQKWRGIPVTICDGSAVITGLLLAMVIPAIVPWYLPLVGGIIAIAIAKHTMGGLGNNVFNPALIGRAFLMASWPVAMTTWPALGVDAATTATPLAILKHEGYNTLVESFHSNIIMYKDLFIGDRSGSAGEVSVLLLVIGALYLIIRRVIDWQVPVTMIATVGLLTWIFGGTGFFAGDPLFAMMSGGLVLGACFMATDMVTTPITLKGRLIFAAGAGILTTVIRLLGGYPEGVCYAILLMNSVTPLIDRLVRPVRYGAGG